MYIDSDLIRGIALLIVLLMVLVSVFGTIIILTLNSILKVVTKMLKIYMFNKP